jgi:maleamate amidohydrolase
MADNVFGRDDWRAMTVGQAIEALAEDRKRLARHGPGQAAAIVVVDVQSCFMRDGDPALLARGRAAGMPVFLVRIFHDSRDDLCAGWRARSRDAAPLGGEHPSTQFHPKLPRDDADVVIEKRHASAFAGTSLHVELMARGIDTVLLAGTSTSGCVRATAVDGSALSYRVLVVEDAVYEPRALSGPVALWDMASRYADVISIGEAIGVLDALAGRSA